MIGQIECWYSNFSIPWSEIAELNLSWLYILQKKKVVKFFRAQSFVRNTDSAALRYSGNKKRLRDNHKKNIFFLQMFRSKRKLFDLCICPCLLCLFFFYKTRNHFPAWKHLFFGLKHQTVLLSPSFPFGFIFLKEEIISLCINYWWWSVNISESYFFNFVFLVVLFPEGYIVINNNRTYFHYKNAHIRGRTQRKGLNRMEI